VFASKMIQREQGFRRRGLISLGNKTSLFEVKSNIQD